MHDSVMQWTRAIVSAHRLTDKSALEVGSYNVNGSVREIFKGPYVGIDVVEGPGVDVVGVARELPFDNEKFDVVVSTEMLEHDATFWLSLGEMKRVLKPQGFLLLTMRGNGFPYHGDIHFKDVYRFMPDSVPMLLQLAGCELLSFEQDPQVPGLFIFGKKS